MVEGKGESTIYIYYIRNLYIGYLYIRERERERERGRGNLYATWLSLALQAASKINRDLPLSLS